MNDVLRIARLKIALQRAFLGRAILRVIVKSVENAIFCVKSVKIYTGQKKFTRIYRGVRDKYEA